MLVLSNAVLIFLGSVVILTPNVNFLVVPLLRPVSDIHLAINNLVKQDTSLLSLTLNLKLWLVFQCAEPKPRLLVERPRRPACYIYLCRNIWYSLLIAFEHSDYCDTRRHVTRLLCLTVVRTWNGRRKWL